MSHHEFLVRIDIDTGRADQQWVDDLREAESARAAELASAGHLLALWRVSGTWANCGLWRARDATELGTLLNSLPLRPFMSIDIQPLMAHPNDPRRVTPLPQQRLGRTPDRWELAPLPGLEQRCRRQTSTTPALPKHQCRPAPVTVEPLAALELRCREQYRGRNSMPAPMSAAGTPPSARSLSAITLEIEVVAALTESDSGGADNELFNRVALCAVNLMRDRRLQSVHDEHLSPVDLLVQSHFETPHLIEGAEQLTHRTLISALRQPPKDPRHARGRRPAIQLTHSGSLGLRSHIPSQSIARLALDVGAITKQVGVRVLPDGAEGIGRRSVALLTLTLHQPDIPLAQAATFLHELCGQVATSGSTPSRYSP